MQISVAMCTYNGERYLEEQLASIAAQSMQPAELVICDDGSRDGTPEIIRAFATRASFPVRLIENYQNLGSTKNFQKAIGLCQGELIALCDQDDIWLPKKLATLAAPLSNDPSVGGAFSNAYLIDSGAHLMGRRLWDEVRFSPAAPIGIVEPKTLLRHNVVTGATLIFRSALREILLPVDSCWIHDGWFAWMLVLYSRLMYVAEPLVKYRLHPAQQLGVATHSSLLKRLRRAREAGNEPQLLLARQFEILRDRWMNHPDKRDERLLGEFDEKILHSYLQAGLPRNKLLRAFRIAQNVQSYQLYSLGFTTMAKDFLR